MHIYAFSHRQAKIYKMLSYHRETALQGAL